MTRITVETSSSYDVLIGEGVSSRLGQCLADMNAHRVVTVCGDTVEKLYADKVEKNLTDAGLEAHTFVYPHGEASKNLATYAKLLGYMADCGLDRQDVVVALGGGVTGDLAGFAAATYMRGIRCVQLPTTLLAMVDSSVGGKTAVDLPQGKNLVGAFSQPSLVLCDTAFLDTLPDEIFADGCAEVVKYAVLSQPVIFDLLRSLPESLDEIIRRSIEIKAEFVKRDERDTGVRQLLNLGHTVGHAIEKYSDFTVSHGRAVAMGLRIICAAAELNGDCESGVCDAVTEALSVLALPISCEYPLVELCKLMQMDKKKSGVDITLAIPRSYGHCELKRISAETLHAYLLPAFGDIL